MSRPEALALVLLVALGSVASVASAPRPPVAPQGASALDALGDLRDAESKSYRLADDGVRTLAMRVSSPPIDVMGLTGGPLAGRDVKITLWWRDGESRVVIEGADGVAPEIVESLRELVKPLPALLLPERPSRSLVGSSFHYRNVGSVLKAGDRGIEATLRDPEAPLRSALFAVSAENLIVGEHFERTSGSVSEFRHQWSLQGGRYLLTGTEGWVGGTRVGADIEWGALVGDRPLPTRVRVLQADIMAPWPEGAGSIELRLTEHRVNVEPPAGLFGPP